MAKLNSIAIFSFFLIILFSACNKKSTPFDKPKKLVKEKQMIDMLVDMHMAEATYSHFRNDSAFIDLTSSVLYYSVLDKYQTPDSVFEKSFVYYASKPRDFEKMYRKVLSKIGEMEQEYSGRKLDPLDIEPSRAR